MPKCNHPVLIPEATEEEGRDQVVIVWYCPFCEKAFRHTYNLAHIRTLSTDEKNKIQGSFGGESGEY